MPLLAKFILLLFNVFVGLFARFFVMQTAAKMAAWSVAMALLLGLATAMMSCITGVCAQSITTLGSVHQGVAMGLGIAFNGVTLTAVSCYMTVWILCQLYVIKKKAINVITGAG